MPSLARPRVVFAGTPEFAATALRALHAAGFEIPLVLTQPDRPAGRGLKLQPSPVKAWAQAHGLPVLQPASLRRGDEAQATCAQLRAIFAAGGPDDLMVVAAYGLILPAEVLSLPPRGCWNIHASLLPRWRGAAPIQRAIEAGDTQTGITLMQMDVGLDTGAMLLKRAVPIAPDDTAATLHDKLAALGAVLVVEALQSTTPLIAQAQPEQGVTYAHKIDKAEGRLDFSLPADVLARRVRAFDPFPGAYGDMAGEMIKFWQAHAQDASTDQVPGTVLSADAQGLRIACRTGVLCVTQLQRPGGKRLTAREFFSGSAWPAGARFNQV